MFSTHPEEKLKQKTIFFLMEARTKQTNTQHKPPSPSIDRTHIHAIRGAYKPILNALCVQHPAHQTSTQHTCQVRKSQAQRKHLHQRTTLVRIQTSRRHTYASTQD
jgi:hypothetical protein